MPGFETNRFVNLEVIDGLIDELRCSICMNIYETAVQTCCGHNFCYGCLKQWIQSNGDRKECPECRQLLSSRKRSNSDNNNTIIISSDVVVDKNSKLNAIIGKLKIRCDYEWNGCSLVMALESLSAHLKECPHRLCPTCCLNVGPSREQHNCIDQLKNEMNNWRNRFLETEQKLKEMLVENNELNRQVMSLQNRVKPYIKNRVI
ncbi:E3 ubiquitin-protein ligase NRDP1-like [Oppia nitens]|uniref:E3 ubiquitin-protein ligase NRDP1-like n=1 Tax=Oppia nitens TaxID=1686743 RepID=UPI0023DC852B|nr:E3 ubiquitin-protein ligase NRDP1-like [Oppia nitens]